MSDSKNVFAYSFEGVYQEDGWKVYDAEKELQRMVRLRNSWGERGVERERGGGGDLGLHFQGVDRSSFMYHSHRVLV